MALLGQLFLNKSLNWPGFQDAVVEGQRNRLGEIKVRKAKQSIYTYPVPDCVSASVRKSFSEMKRHVIW